MERKGILSPHPFLLLHIFSFSLAACLKMNACCTGYKRLSLPMPYISFYARSENLVKHELNLDPTCIRVNIYFFKELGTPNFRQSQLLSAGHKIN